MSDCIRDVYATILDRRDNPSENSYTRYFLDPGIYKILKKGGVECAETLIAAKNGRNDETAGEICDLTSQELEQMALQGITPEDVEAILTERHGNAGNLKTFKKVDRNS